MGGVRRRLAGRRGTPDAAGAPPRRRRRALQLAALLVRVGGGPARAATPRRARTRDRGAVGASRCVSNAFAVPALRDPCHRGVVRGRRAARSRERRRARRVPRPRRVLTRARRAVPEPRSVSPTTPRWSVRWRGSTRSRASTCCSTRSRSVRAARPDTAARRSSGSPVLGQDRYAAELRERVADDAGRAAPRLPRRHPRRHGRPRRARAAVDRTRVVRPGAGRGAGQRHPGRGHRPRWTPGARTPGRARHRPDRPTRRRRGPRGRAPRAAPRRHVTRTPSGPRPRLRPSRRPASPEAVPRRVAERCRSLTRSSTSSHALEHAAWPSGTGRSRPATRARTVSLACCSTVRAQPGRDAEAATVLGEVRPQLVAGAGATVVGVLGDVRREVPDTARTLGHRPWSVVRMKLPMSRSSKISHSTARISDVRGTSKVIARPVSRPPSSTVCSPPPTRNVMRSIERANRSMDAKYRVERDDVVAVERLGPVVAELLGRERGVRRGRGIDRLPRVRRAVVAHERREELDAVGSEPAAVLADRRRPLVRPRAVVRW